MNVFAGLSTPEKILWACLIFLVAGYALGTWLNRRRSQQVGRWLESGIKRLGGRATWKFVRSVSSGGQANVREANAPFREVQLNYALLTRELLPLWGYERLTGRRDLLAVRANLRSEPEGEVEVLPVAGRLRRKVDATSGEHPWQWQEGPAGLGIGCRGQVEDKLLNAIRRFLERYGTDVQRLSIRPSGEVRKAAGGMYLAKAGPRPAGQGRAHMMLFLNLGPVERNTAASLVDAMRDVARYA